MRAYYTLVLNLEAAKFLRNITINEKVLLFTTLQFILSIICTIT